MGLYFFNKRSRSFFREDLENLFVIVEGTDPVKVNDRKNQVKYVSRVPRSNLKLNLAVVFVGKNLSSILSKN